MSENRTLALGVGLAVAAFLATVMTFAIRESERAEACRLKGGVLIRTATEPICVKAEVLEEETK